MSDPAPKTQPSPQSQARSAQGHLSEEQIERIIELKISRIPETRIAAEVGCSRKAVRYNWRKHLDAAAAKRAASMDANREELLQRYDKIATDAHLSAMKCRSENDHTAAVRYMEVEKGALKEMGRLQGLESSKLEVRNVTVDAIDAEIARLEAEIAKAGKGD